MDKHTLSLWFLRVGIASVFLYAAFASTINPDNWIGYFPPFMVHLLPERTLLGIFSFYELALSVWLLSTWKTFYAALLSALTLVGIIVGNIIFFDVVFRDIAIFFAALSLAALTYSKKR